MACRRCRSRGAESQPDACRAFECECIAGRCGTPDALLSVGIVQRKRPHRSAGPFSLGARVYRFGAGAVVVGPGTGEPDGAGPLCVVAGVLLLAVVVRLSEELK